MAEKVVSVWTAQAAADVDKFLPPDLAAIALNYAAESFYNVTVIDEINRMLVTVDPAVVDDVMTQGRHANRLFVSRDDQERTLAIADWNLWVAPFVYSDGSPSLDDLLPFFETSTTVVVTPHALEALFTMADLAREYEVPFSKLTLYFDQKRPQSDKFLRLFERLMYAPVKELSMVGTWRLPYQEVNYLQEPTSEFTWVMSGLAFSLQGLHTLKLSHMVISARVVHLLVSEGDPAPFEVLELRSVREHALEGFDVRGSGIRRSLNKVWLWLDPLSYVSQFTEDADGNMQAELVDLKPPEEMLVWWDVVEREDLAETETVIGRELVPMPCWEVTPRRVDQLSGLSWALTKVTNSV